MLGAIFVQWDADCFDELSGMPLHVANSGLLEEPGRIEALFTDKTGTLTTNKMEFMAFYVTDDNVYSSDTKLYSSKLDELLHAVCLANDVS